ncbi:hypothetical protein L596_011588 [Steinernema carpocapsae]|uniref:Uncharacterized protein n=1 Tax=Steinernema carpocapsae TaxID=34508 RepID=A0A4U5NVB4_STECR|nr:hypothetical protein L596_011588 [Steinernema carpocapsae]
MENANRVKTGQMKESYLQNLVWNRSTQKIEFASNDGGKPNVIKVIRQKPTETRRGRRVKGTENSEPGHRKPARLGQRGNQLRREEVRAARSSRDLRRPSLEDPGGPIRAQPGLLRLRR